ncbi:ribonuclease R [Deinococcus sp.]|uniref:ribonuclease R n=1 Tax=Deinococcus sp. TaxID=47478 RepID=UPI0025C2B130|nr:ribonuclease R [Deinococcus sp.]
MREKVATLPAEQDAPAADSSASTSAAQPPARRGRKPKQALTEPLAEQLAEPVPVAGAAAAEPVLLERPKKQRGRKPRGAPETALAEVLDGVEAVPVGPVTAEPVTLEPVTVEPAPVEVPAAQSAEPAPAALAPAAVTHETSEPALDLTTSEQAVPPAKATRRGRKGAAAQVQAPESSEAAASAVQTPEGALESASAPEPESPQEAQPGPHNDLADDAEVQEQVALEQVQPEQSLVLTQLRKIGRPIHVRDLEKTFTRQALERIGGWRNLTDLLEELAESGQVIRTRKKMYGLPEAMSLVRGRFQASAAGFGFVIPDSGGEDYYVPEGKTMEAWNGDIVLVRIEGRGDSRNDSGRGGSRRGQKGDGNPRASVVRFVQRAYKQLVGTLEFSHGHPILKPDDHRARHRILMLPEGLEDLEAGARVVSELYWPEITGEDEVFGQVVRVLGTEDDPVTETEAVIVKFGLRGDFPEEVVEQANAIPAQIPAEALKDRLDLRSFNIFTVDGRDAKDFDDAIHIQPTPEGNFVVGVHIADVSHYVREGTPLDTEAYARATSVYLPGRVLPMLPEHLSNGVCSLVPNEDRLTMTALVELSAEGEILKVQLAPSVINSKARLTYDEVQAYSEATATLPDHARQLEGDLHLLLKITTKLRQKRLREGSLDFKLREVKVDVGPDGRMELIPIREETARGMIEDLMLLANKVVAHYLIEREIPTLFRIHEEPTLQRFQDVSAAIGRLGQAFPGGQPTPQAYQAVLKAVRGTPRESVVNTLLLRSMQQAKYAGENVGHFGLAFDEYLHFTSPIRRYPDLVVHRTLKRVLLGELRAGSREVAAFQARLPGMGEHTSDAERKAAEAERDLTKYYQCKWAQEHKGESFPGTVSGVTASGLYVSLENGVEGKLHISYLDDDYYAYIEDAQMLKGRRTGQSFRLGDPVNVTIQEVKPMARQIDLVKADPTSPDYRPGDINAPQENVMDSPVKPRARRREDREAEHREKLAAVPVSAPKKFTLDEDAATETGLPRPPREGGSYRQGQRPQAGRTQGGRREERTFGGVSMNGQRTESQRGRSAGGSRRVITLERPRNEHLRPVNITVQRMYFGDWSLDNMPPEEGPSQARGGRERGYNRQERSERGGQISGTARSQTRGGSDRPAVQNPNGRAARQEAAPAAASASLSAQQSLTEHTLAPQGLVQPQHNLASPSAAQTAQSEEAKRRRRRRGRRTPGAPSSSE